MFTSPAEPHLRSSRGSIVWRFLAKWLAILVAGLVFAYLADPEGFHEYPWGLSGPVLGMAACLLVGAIADWNVRKRPELRWDRDLRFTGILLGISYYVVALVGLWFAQGLDTAHTMRFLTSALIISFVYLALIVVLYVIHYRRVSRRISAWRRSPSATS